MPAFVGTITLFAITEIAIAWERIDPIKSHHVMRKEERIETTSSHDATLSASGEINIHFAPDGIPATPISTTPLGLRLGAFETEVYQRINITSKKYGIHERFPVPNISVYLEDTRRGCVLGGGTCDIFEKQGKFWADPHVRDIVASALTPCLFKKEKCLALDLGTNFGYHAMTMLQFNTNVTTVEPEPSLCASFMRSVERNGFADFATIHCGGVSEGKDDKVKWFADFNPSQSSVYGTPKVPFDYGIYGFKNKGVPYVSLDSLLPYTKDNGSPPTLQLVKIDTDHIDCDIVSRLLLHLKKKDFDIKHMVFEHSGPCGDLPEHLHDFQGLGFAVYRTLLWQAKFDGGGHLPSLLTHSVPSYAEEKFDLRFNRYLWQFQQMSVDEWKKAVANTNWQFYLTKEHLESNEMSIAERT